MKRIYLLIAAIVVSVNVNAQAPDWLWAKSIGGEGSDAGNSLITDANGNIYTTGFFVSTVDFDPGAGVFNLTAVDTFEYDIFITKTDTAGNFIWAKSMGGMSMDIGRSITFDAFGNGAVYLTGTFKGTADFDPGAGAFNLTTASPGVNDIFICKLDTAGNFIWAKAMGGMNDDAAYSITIDPSGTGDVYVMGYFGGSADFDPNAGVFNLNSAGSTDVFVSKYNSSGNLIWAKAMGGIASDWGLDIAISQTGSADIYTTGYFSGTGDFDPGTGISNLTSAGLDDIFISKLDSSGNLLWAKRMGGTDGDYATAITTDISGNVYTTGRFRLTSDFDPGAGIHNLVSKGAEDIFISKLDSSGNFVWAYGIGSTTYDTGNDICLDALGNVYVTGGFTGIADFDPGIFLINLTPAGNTDIFITKCDNSGNFVWATNPRGLNGDNSRSLSFDGSGHLYIAGAFSSTTLAFATDTIFNYSVGQSDLFIAKLDVANTIDIESISNSQFPISIYPNPFNSEITVNMQTAFGMETGEIKIFDTYGRLVYTQKLTTAKLQLTTAQWKQGIYFIEVKTDMGKTVRKIMKY